LRRVAGGHGGLVHFTNVTYSMKFTNRVPRLDNNYTVCLK